jgi:hypothetical protein
MDDMAQVIADANKMTASLLQERDRLAAECELLKQMLPCKPGIVDRLHTAGLLVQAIECCRKYGVELGDVFSRRKTKSIAAARAELYALARERGKSTTETARIFGRDHSTVSQVCKAKAVRNAVVSK